MAPSTTPAPEDPSGWQIHYADGRWWPQRKGDEATLDGCATKEAAVSAIEACEAGEE
jgi:hypothetical protein